MVKITFYDPDDDKPKKRRGRRKKKKQGTGFTLNWVEELGWEADPFNLEEVPISDMEDERQEINLFFVKKKQLGTILSPEGMGKTTLLTWLQEELKGYKNLEAYSYNCSEATTDERFRVILADEFRSMFKRGDDITREQLVEIISNKVDGKYVLLLDDAEHLTQSHMETLEALLYLDCSIILATNNKLKGLPCKDELHLTLKKRTAAQYEKILADRIAMVGGTELKPFNQKVVRTMGEDTGNVQGFLDLAHETAINIALKKVSLEGEEVDEDDLAEEEEAKAEKKKGVQKKEQESSSGTEYDELIESLAEDI